MFCNVNVKVFIIVEFVYVRVNGTQEYVQDSLNTTTVVVLKVLFPYGFIYKLGPPMSEKQVKESESRVTPPLFPQAVTMHVQSWHTCTGKMYACTGKVRIPTGLENVTCLQDTMRPFIY